MLILNLLFNFKFSKMFFWKNINEHFCYLNDFFIFFFYIDIKFHKTQFKLICDFFDFHQNVTKKNFDTIFEFLDILRQLVERSLVLNGLTLSFGKCHFQSRALGLAEFKTCIGKKTSQLQPSFYQITQHHHSKSWWCFIY